MSKKEIDFFKWAFFRLFITSAASEIIFRIISFSQFWNLSLVRILLFTLAVTAAIASLASFLPVKAGRWVVNIIMWFFCIYVMVQAGLKNLVGNYLSIRSMGTGAGKFGDYVTGFLVSLQYRWLLLASPIAVCIFLKADPVKVENKKMLMMTLAVSIGIDLIGLGTVYGEGVQNYYYSIQFPEQTIQKFGMGRYLLLDLVNGNRSMELVSEEEKEEEETSVQSRQNDIDDSVWRKAAEEETNADMKQIDQYLLNRRITNYNDHTGMLKGKNVIYIMIEAFSFIAIDPKLTPTLSRIRNEGWYFADHYTPHYAWGTGDSELISEVSLVPEAADNTINTYATNQWNDSIFHQFHRAGYATRAYHNWKDQFYDRRILYAHSDMDSYENYDDLTYSNVRGWQSDKQMMELTLPEYIDAEEPWFTMYVTSTTHFPYNKSTYYGDAYLDEIDQVHPDYDINVKRYLSKAMELDKALEYLIDQLKEHNKLDDTLIVMYADHHPLDTMEPLLHEYVKDVDTSIGFNEDRSPFLMYGAGLTHEKYDFLSSTFDIAPTVMNLLGIDYEPRIYLGRDLFSDSEEFIPYPDGSWITSDGIYQVSKGSFTPFEGKKEMDAVSISHYNILCQNMFSVSRLIFENDYFAKRKCAAEPVYTDSYTTDIDASASPSETSE